MGLAAILLGALANQWVLESYVLLDGQLLRPRWLWLAQICLGLGGVWLVLSARSARHGAPGAARRTIVFGSIAAVLAGLATMATAELALHYALDPRLSLTGDLHHEYVWRQEHAPGASQAARHLHEEFDPELGWRPVEVHRCDGDGGTAINAAGLRSTREYSVERVPGVRRIVVAGDSYAWGAGVRNEDAFPSVLENRLEATEVINLGVIGYGTDQQYLRIRRLGLGYRPDLVIDTFFEHDLERNGLSFYAYAKPRYVVSNGELRLSNVPVPPPEAVLAREFRLPSLLLPGVVRDFANRLVDKTRLRPFEGRETWQVTRAIFDAMKRDAREAGARFLLVFVPYPARDVSAIERAVRGWAAESGTPLVNMREEFRSLSDAEFAAVHSPHHWSPDGHRIAAEAIRALVERDRLLD